jgi:hypothetical protein
MPAQDSQFQSACLKRTLRNLCHLVALVLAGCGGVPNTSTNLLSELAADDCPGAATDKATAADAVLLEWSGGTTRIYPGEQLSGLDLAAFRVTDGGTLAEEADDFKAAVRDEVSRILCDMPTDGIFLTNTKSGLPGRVTTVYFSQMASPMGGSQIGQGEYDPCNLDHDNDAIIFGDEILALGDARPFEEWVVVFANVTAHEIGHMLGYGHVPRVIYPASQRPAFVELMMATHTVPEMTQAQRLISDTTNCPDDHDATASRDRIITLHCSHE